MANLIKCKSCGNEISKNAKTCPKCGEPLKRKLSIFWWIIIVIVVLNIITFINHSDEKVVSEKEVETKGQKALNKLNYYKENKAEILEELNNYYSSKEYQKGINLADKYHNFLDDSFNEIRTKLILAKLKEVPVKEYKENYDYYKDLVQINPNNTTYKNKLSFYQEKIDEVEAKQVAEKIFYGNKPIQSGWDGSYSEVKNYLSYAMKDPDSLDIRECSNVYKIDNVGWAVHCSYRGKNSFGAVVLNSNWFIIRNNKVVKVEPSGTYSLR